MKRHSPVLRMLIKVSAAMGGVVLAGLAVTGCSPVKVGAAAIVGSQRVTVATLDTEVTNLAQGAKPYSSIVQLTPTQMTQDTLSWLIRFQIRDEFASQHGITVTTAQQQAALAEIYSVTKQEAEAQGVTNVTPDLVLVAYGVPPNLYDELGRYQAIENEFLARSNGGKIPTTTAGLNAAEAKLGYAECLVAKSLTIQVNPQYGVLDYSQYTVVTAPDTVSRPSGATPSPSPSGLTPAC